MPDLIADEDVEAPPVAADEAQEVAADEAQEVAADEDVEAATDEAQEADGIEALDRDLEMWERIEDEYGIFQREPVEFINYHLVYMARVEEGYRIRDVRSKILDFAEGVTQLESSVLMSLVKNNEIHNRRRYKTHKVLRYNVTASMRDIEAVNRAASRELDPPPAANAATYFREVEGFPTVPYEDTMLELDEQNALFVFLVEDVAAKGAHRRRSRGHPKVRPKMHRATTRRH